MSINLSYSKNTGTKNSYIPSTRNQSEFSSKSMIKLTRRINEHKFPLNVWNESVNNSLIEIKQSKQNKLPILSFKKENNSNIREQFLNNKKFNFNNESTNGTTNKLVNDSLQKIQKVSNVISNIRLHGKGNKNLPSFTINPPSNNNMIIEDLASGKHNFQNMKLKQISFINSFHNSTLSVNKKHDADFILKQEYEKNNDKRIKIKKQIREKLIKTMAKSLVIDEDALDNINRKKVNAHDNNKIQEHVQEYRRDHKIGIVTQKSPLLSSTNLYVSRYEDVYISPDEMISRNFEENEINEIKSDKNYFKLDTDLFKGSKILKYKNLVETLKREDNIINFITKRKEGQSNSVSYGNLKNVFGKGFKELLGGVKVQNKNKHKNKLKSLFNDIKMPQIRINNSLNQSYLPTLIEGNISLNKETEVKKLINKYEIKHEAYGHRRKLIDEMNYNNANESKNLYKQFMKNRLVRNNKSVDDTLMTKLYVIQIKSNYKGIGIGANKN